MTKRPDYTKVFETVNVGPFASHSLSHEYQIAFCEQERRGEFKTPIEGHKTSAEGMKQTFALYKKHGHGDIELTLMELFARRDLRKEYGYDASIEDNLLEDFEGITRLKDEPLRQEAPHLTG